MNASASELRKFVAPEIIFGVGALGQVGQASHKLAAKRALVVTDPGVTAAGWVDLVLDSLRREHVPAVVFDEVTPNPKDHEVTSGTEVYRAHGCDIIIAVGGGSAMDCAKGIGIVSANGSNILAFEGVDEVPIPIPPLICIPTTAGTSADVSQFAIIVDMSRKVKTAIISKTVVPDIALVDPSTTTTMSSELTAATGIDALVHAIESYVSNASSPLTDIHALQAISLISANLIQAIENPAHMEYRKNMMLASLLAGLAFSNASLGLVHAMAHSLGGLFDLPHGVCNALLLAQVVEFNYLNAADRYDQIARAMGLKIGNVSSSDRKFVLLEGIDQIRQQAGIRQESLNLELNHRLLSELATNASLDPCIVTNPREATIEDIEVLYEQAFCRI